MNETAIEHWPAPSASGPIDARVELPGSKSITNRALPLAALATEPSILRGALRSRDTDLMVAGLRALGVGVDDSGADWHINPAPMRGPANVDCGLAGTVMRFLVATSALAEGNIFFDGDPHARKRPMRPLLDGLRQLEIRIDDNGRGALPLTVVGTGHLAGGRCAIDSSTSSQFISALLLAAARADDEIVVTHVGGTLPSLPHIAMTVAMLRDRGIDVGNSDALSWRVTPGRIRGGSIDIEPDLSNAAPFAAAALATGGTVRFARWPSTTTQPGAELPALLERMGATCSLDGGDLVVHGTQNVHGIDVDLHDTSELTPTLAVLAAIADSPSTLRGIGHIRGHETDRLAALAREINDLGGDVTEAEDSLMIRPKPLTAGVFHTYDDHRLATSAAVLGLVVPGILVENIDTTAKTMPEFADLWHALLT